jgi:hypothetical protein
MVSDSLLHLAAGPAPWQPSIQMIDVDSCVFWRTDKITRCRSHQRAAAEPSEMATAPQDRACNRIGPRRPVLSGSPSTYQTMPRSPAAKHGLTNPVCLAILPVCCSLARTLHVQFLGASTVTVCRPSARASGLEWPRCRLRWRALASWSHDSRGLALVASTAPALATASTASTAGELPAVGGGFWAVTAARRLRDVSGPASAPVPCVWLPQSWPENRRKAPVTPRPTGQTGTVSGPLGGWWAAGKSVAG